MRIKELLDRRSISLDGAPSLKLKKGSAGSDGCPDGKKRKDQG